MQLNVHEAKTQLSRLLELVEEGETVIIARHGEPRRRTHPGPPPGRLSVRHRRAGPLVAPGDDWWQPMSNREAEDWIEGR